jgi:signal transduction histidine kinase
MADLDLVLALTAVLGLGLGAVALGLLRQLAPKVRGTPLWIPVMVLFLCAAVANLIVGSVALVAERGEMELGAQLSRGVSVCTLLGEAALVHLLLGAPRRAVGVLPYALVSLLYVVAFGAIVIAPSGLLFGGNEVVNGYPVPHRAPIYWFFEGTMVVGMVVALAWQVRIALAPRRPSEAKASRSLILSLVVPLGLYLASPSLGLSIESGRSTGILVGMFVGGVYLSIRTGRLPLPVPTTLQGVLGAARNPVMLIDAEGVVVLCNPAAHAVLGVSQDAVGQPFESMLRASFPTSTALDGAAAHVGDVLLAKVPRFDGPAGELGPASTPFRLVIDPLITERDSTKPGAAVVQFIDETQRRDAERAAARLRDLQDLVIRVMGHDLKAPIAVMQGNLEIAKMDIEAAALDAEAKKALVARLDKANQAAAGMQVTLANARAISRIEMAPGSTPRAEPLDLAKIVKETAELLRPLADAKAQALTVRTPPALRVALPPGFESVVSNLVSNAIKYTPEKGAVEVALDRSGGSAVFTVADSGPGIPVEKRALLFRKFERLALEQSVASHGLGLSIASSIVELAGGTIAALDRPDGAKGTLFRVEVPAPADGPAP